MSKASTSHGYQHSPASEGSANAAAGDEATVHNHHRGLNIMHHISFILATLRFPVTMLIVSSH